jgi:uncharacterized protein (TIGR02268 family)
VLSELPAGGELELRVATGVLSVVRFDAQVVRAELKGAEAERLVRMEVAARSLQLEPLRELTASDELRLEVVLAQAPVHARLVIPLVSHPTEVDTRVDLELRPRSSRTAAESASPRREDGPPSPFPVTGMMKKLGFSTDEFHGSALGTGVRVEETWDYWVARGRLIVLDVYNPEGARPWFSSEVVRVSPAGVVLEGDGGWAVHMEAPIEPGGHGEVLVVAPEVERDAPVRLEVRERGGSRVIRMKELR